MAAAKKKPTTRKTTKRKRTTTTRSTSRSRAQSVRSQRASFMKAEASEQTIYWLIIGVAVIALAIWILSLQTQLNDAYNQIETDASTNSYIPSRNQSNP